VESGSASFIIMEKNSSFSTEIPENVFIADIVPVFARIPFAP